MPNSDRILVVEDDADSRALLYTILNGAGHSVLTADNGQQAIDLFERGIRPRLLIVDLMLPRVSGQDLIQFAHEDPALKFVPVIVVSATAVRPARLMSDAFLAKPIRPAELLARVSELLERNRQEPPRS